jgi:hypothetical protein
MLRRPGAAVEEGPRIGFVSSSGDPNDPGPNVEAFRHGKADRSHDSTERVDESGQGHQVILDFRLPIFRFSASHSG